MNANFIHVTAHSSSGATFDIGVPKDIEDDFLTAVMGQ